MLAFDGDVYTGLDATTLKTADLRWARTTCCCHAPGRASRATLVPTNALELVEPRLPPTKPFDCLVQHLGTLAAGTGFVADDLFDEVRTAYSYRDLTRAEFDWAVAFDEGTGGSLSASPDDQRIAKDAEGIYRVPRADLARRHRMSIGTITAERERAGTFSISMNDYGFELLSAERFDWKSLIADGLLSTDGCSRM